MIRLDWKCRTMLRAIGTDADIRRLLKRHGATVPTATIRGWHTRNSIPGWAMPVLIHELTSTGLLKDLSTLRDGATTRKVRADTKATIAKARRDLNRPTPQDIATWKKANAEARKVFAAAPLGSVQTKWRDHLRALVRSHADWSPNRDYFEQQFGKKARDFTLDEWTFIAEMFGIDHAQAKAVFLATMPPLKLVVA